MISDKVLIFGGSGFIGSNLLQYYPQALSISMRSFSEHDHLPPASVFVNLVGKAHDHAGNAEESEYVEVNVELAKTIFQLFVCSSAELLIHVSSLAALEETESENPLNEVDKSNPISVYGKSKRAAELWLLEQKLPVGKKLIIIRPPMVHGPGDKGNLGLLYKLVSKGIPYPLASFDNSRSFICIQNFCFFIDQILSKYDLLESGIYHIADDEAVSTTQIIKIITEVTNKKILNLSLPRQLIKSIAIIGDYIPIPLNTKRLKKMTSDLQVSNIKIKTALGIQKLPLTAEEGLRKTILSFKSH
ncbi:NAD-dependent epimerase/dehydratase family protein [Sphingobacterium multivorum]|uniref:UDP-glucose 4-epimerase n=1 Tax=Sphingobacterium multivorum TaxID=28454 RepID=A0A653XTB4_SPHMU|nr:NAD-dependent epimerase/dehydratase family protein [Sphingobacterium multivorum]VXC33372.1 UDP-glucose 4-epimerase [Sphingobacterium multivorum]